MTRPGLRNIIDAVLLCFLVITVVLAHIFLLIFIFCGITGLLSFVCYFVLSEGFFDSQLNGIVLFTKHQLSSDFFCLAKKNKRSYYLGDHLSENCLGKISST